MKVYIAASWRHEHCVRLLTERLRERGHDVLSFVEASEKTGEREVAGLDDALDWIWSERGARIFASNTQSATTADAVVYIGPSGTDAWAEVGAAWASGVPVFGLSGKAEVAGLMRRMVNWCHTHDEVLQLLEANATILRTAEADCRAEEMPA